MNFSPGGRVAIVVGGVVALLVVIGGSFLLFGGSSGSGTGASTSTVVGGTSTTTQAGAGATTTSTAAGATTTLGASTAISRNAAVFIDQDVAATTLSMLHGSKVVTQSVLNQAIAKVPGSKGIVATVVGGKATLKMKVSEGGQSAYACATFTGTSREATILASCP